MKSSSRRTEESTFNDRASQIEGTPILSAPYKDREKPPEPGVCPQCQAVFHHGRWQWAESWPAYAHSVLCQACRRIRDDYPAGSIALTGGFVPAHRDEILALARHLEAEEKGRHPLHRLMKIEEGADSIVIQTTDLHLPRRIGEALRHAFKGEMEMHDDEEGCLLWVNESRQD